MFQIIAHVKPTSTSRHFGLVEGAYVVVFINFKDIDGAFELTKYYIASEGWEFIEFDEEYYLINSKEEMGDDYQKYFDEIQEYGYAMIFNTYPFDEE